MDLFDYEARNRRGEILRGTIEANNAQAAAASLIGTDIFPISIKPKAKAAEQPEWVVKLLRQDRVSPVELSLFTRQMANMVRAGMQMMDAVDGMQKTTESPGMKKVLAAVRDDLDRGIGLSNAMSRHPVVFSEFYVNMVRVGEATGQLETAFRNLHHQLEFDRNLRQRMKSALRYPSFVLIAISIALTILSIFVIPAFAKTYEGLKVQLPLITRILIAVSHFATAYWWAVAIIGAGLIYGVRESLKQPDIRYQWDRRKLRMPIFGSILFKGTVARFSRSFAIALKSNMPIVNAFQLAGRVSENAFFEDRVQQMRAGVERGEILSRVMRTAGIFSPLELQLITVAEKTGEVDNAVDEIAQLYSEEVEYQVARLSQTVEPLLLAVMGVLVGILVLGIFLPMWDLGQAQLGKH